MLAEIEDRIFILAETETVLVLTVKDQMESVGTDSNLGNT